VPALLVDVPALERGIDARDFAPGPLLERSARVRETSQRSHKLVRLGPVQERHRFLRATPPIVVVLIVEPGLPALGHLDSEAVDDDLLDIHCEAGTNRRRLSAQRVAVAAPEIDHKALDAGTDLLLQLASRGLGGGLVLLERPGDDVPVHLLRARSV